MERENLEAKSGCGHSSMGVYWRGLSPDVDIQKADYGDGGDASMQIAIRKQTKTMLSFAK